MISEGIDLITADFLMTFTGAVLATNIITHFVKDYTPDCIDRKIVTLVVAAFVMFSNQLVFHTLSLKSLYLTFLNSFLVATAAMGNYEVLSNKMKRRIEKDLEKEKVLQKEKELEKEKAEIRKKIKDKV
ncbi:hypothetical protein SAMN05660297_03156 [Natronincola peptidivorans]|uniref:Uncharacterized protein n=1 Tax=Natronincola peptidivorans TaxID=426128 RepID=A0A1I0GDC7_9FIRM|nr:hypothetical protein [Natronincola peptidivorans]SET68915.1 hypothetical protein SAMN05660297_03156 [Natronincola peptidivorans]